MSSQTRLSWEGQFPSLSLSVVTAPNPDAPVLDSALSGRSEFSAVSSFLWGWGLTSASVTQVPASCGTLSPNILKNGLSARPVCFGSYEFTHHLCPSVLGPRGFYLVFEQDGPLQTFPVLTAVRLVQTLWGRGKSELD